MDPTYLGHPIPTPTAQPRGGLMTKRTLFLIIGAIVALAVGMIMIFASGDNSATLRQRVSARQATTIKLIADGQKNITRDDIAKINSELSIVLASDNSKLQTALKTAGLKKTDKTITAAEADAATFEKLKTAKLNAQYDSTYLSVLTQKLESLRGLLVELNENTRSRSLKAATADEYRNLGIYLNALSRLPN